MGSYKDGHDNDSQEKKQKDQYDEHSWDKKEKDANSIVNIVKVNVNCCDHKKDQDKEDCDHKKNLYKKGYWDYKEERYKEY